MRKYFVKVFKGCMDNIEEYQNDIKTISFSRKSLWFSHVINKGRMKKISKNKLYTMKSYRLKKNVSLAKLFEAEEKRRRQIPITDFTRGGEMLIVKTVENMQKAKENLESLVYGGQVVNPETEDRLLDMQQQLCSMLDELPW